MFDVYYGYLEQNPGFLEQELGPVGNREKDTTNPDYPDFAFNKWKEKKFHE